MRIGVAPSQTERVLSAAQDIATRHTVRASCLAFPGAATVYCCLRGALPALADVVNGLAAVAGEMNGNLVVERCPRALKERVSVWHPGGADALTRRVKQTFDARGILNPGRFVGGL